MQSHDDNLFGDGDDTEDFEGYSVYPILDRVIKAKYRELLDEAFEKHLDKGE